LSELYIIISNIDQGAYTRDNWPSAKSVAWNCCSAR